MTPYHPRILHVLEATLGGTRRYLHDLCEATRDSGLSQGLAYASARADSGFDEVRKAMVSAGWTLYPLPMTRQVKPYEDLRATLGMRRIVAAFKPDIVHAHSSKAGAVARLARIFWRRTPPVLYSPHALSVDLGRRFLAIERVLAYATTAFVAVSESERKDIIGYGLAPSNRVHVVRPIIDITRFAPVDRAVARQQLGLPRRPTIVAIGRFTAQKDPLGFIKLLALVRQTHPDVRGVLVGDGELRGAVLQEARRIGLADALETPGWVTDVRPYVGAADIVISAARFESFGYATAEALAMGVPVVATKVTGTLDVMGPENEWMFPYGDWNAGAVLVRRLLDDDNLLAQVGQRGRRRVSSEFERNAMTESLRQLYDDVIFTAG